MTLKANADQPSTPTFYPRTRSEASIVTRLRRAREHSRELAYDAGCAFSAAEGRLNQTGLRISEAPAIGTLAIGLLAPFPMVERSSIFGETILAPVDDEEDENDEDDEYEDDDEDYDENDEDDEDYEEDED